MLSYSYDVYGEATASAETDNPYTFNGEYTDALTGNQYLRARYYNPRTVSFLSSVAKSLPEQPTRSRHTMESSRSQR
ncbi:RHS repeat-associated core domain-containing protein [Dorea sp. D27]|uniref:RHS repeat-associated core domain-containing protein n=1 Tax=Dorea sp. D27 TaxID=658665 RepID=UPI0006732E82|nr:RHS repeat-associated core domain-containing protein [Dorea sp. D27]KMZ54867.1 Rhs family protein [Dorea sp. D27]